VLKYIYIIDPRTGAAPIRVPLLHQAVLCLIAFSIVALGCAPNLLLRWL
jgi:hypothetical protein